jgi:predicted helicase
MPRRFCRAVNSL